MRERNEYPEPKGRIYNMALVASLHFGTIAAREYAAWTLKGRMDFTNKLSI